MFKLTRQFVLMAVIAALCIISFPSDSAHGQTRNRTKKSVGCGLSNRFSSTAEVGQILFTGTGNWQLDQSIQNDVLELRRLFGVSAAMYLLQESDSPNAMAFSRITDDLLAANWMLRYQFPDGMVLLGTALMRKEFASSQTGGFAIPAIIGHEFAHIAQYKYGFPHNDYRRELHSDFLAGWFIGHRSRFLQQDAMAAMKSVYNKGDYDFNSEGHHGTPAQRLAAFQAGLRLNLNGNIADPGVAFQVGLMYVNQLPEQ